MENGIRKGLRRMGHPGGYFSVGRMSGNGKKDKTGYGCIPGISDGSLQRTHNLLQIRQGKIPCRRRIHAGIPLVQEQIQTPPSDSISPSQGIEKRVKPFCSLFRPNAENFPYN